MGSTRLLSSEKIIRELFEGAKGLWENSLFFDFTLEVEEESIPVHKVVLASCSGYFRAMFNSSMKESSRTSVELKGLAVNAVKSVMNFIYTGNIELSEEILEDVLSAAHYLQIHSAVSLCFDYLLEDMTWGSVCHVKQLAQMYALDDVEKKVENFMLANFSEMPDEAVESVGKDILKLVASNSLCVDSEYARFEKLLLFKPILSEDELYEAMSQVRFPLMSKSEVKKVSKNRVMVKLRFSHLMDEAREYHKDVMRQPLLQTERTQVRSDKEAMIIVDNNTITGVYEDQKTKIIRRKFFRIGALYGECFVQKIVSVDNFLYVCEKVHVPAGNNYIGFFRYDPRFNTWKELIPLSHTDRTLFSLVVCGKEIFAIGGYMTKTMEIYDIQTNKWRFGANINYKSLNSAGVALGDKIHVCGGGVVPDEDEEEDEEDDYPVNDGQCLDTHSCYDPVNNTWEFKAPLKEARSWHQGVVYDGKWYVFSGIDGSKSQLFSVEYYSPDVDQWTIFYYALASGFGGVCSTGSDIYVLERHDEENKANSETMKVTFSKFNMETHNFQEEEEFSIEVRRCDSLLVRDPPFQCSKLMLPFNFVDNEL